MSGLTSSAEARQLLLETTATGAIIQSSLTAGTSSSVSYENEMEDEPPMQRTRVAIVPGTVDKPVEDTYPKIPNMFLAQSILDAAQSQESSKKMKEEIKTKYDAFANLLKARKVQIPPAAAPPKPEFEDKKDDADKISTDFVVVSNKELKDIVAASGAAYDEQRKTVAEWDNVNKLLDLVLKQYSGK